MWWFPQPPQRHATGHLLYVWCHLIYASWRTSIHSREGWVGNFSLCQKMPVGGGDLSWDLEEEHFRKKKHKGHKAGRCLACSRNREKDNELDCGEWGKERSSEREVGTKSHRILAAMLRKLGFMLSIIGSLWSLLIRRMKKREGTFCSGTFCKHVLVLLT